MRKILICALAIFIGVSCAKDKGNYDYSDINTITQEEVGGTYRVERFESLVIPAPKLTFKLGEITDLSYEWKINYKIVSTEKDLNVKVTAELGKQPGTLIVTDNATKLKYYFEFTVYVETRYARGVHFLVEKEGGESSLSFLRRDIDPPYVFLTDIYRQENPEMGELGRKPVQLVASKDQNWSWSLYVLNGEGNKIAVLNKETLKLSQIVNEKSVLGSDVATEKFNPVYMTNLIASLIIADNKAYMYGILGTKTLYRPSETDCKFSPYAYSYDARIYSYWFAYDENKSQLVMLNAKQLGTGDAFAFDVVTPFGNETGSYLLKSSGFIGEVRESEKETATYQLAMYDKNTKSLAFYNHSNEFKIDKWGNILGVTNTVTLSSKTDIADDNSVYFFAPATRYWYIASGNKLYRKFWDVTTTPELIWESKTGAITAITANLGEYGMEEAELYVATYDAGSSKAKKSSFYVIDTESKKEVEGYDYVLDKCVSIAFVSW